MEYTSGLSGPCSIFAADHLSMIQRKQTLFLLLAVACALLTFIFPIARYGEMGQVDHIYRTTGVVTSEGVPVTDFEPKFPMYPVFVLIAAVLLVSIFFFSRRMRQALIVRSSYLIILVAEYLMFSQHISIASYLGSGKHLQSTFGVSMFLPIGTLMFAVLAERAIRKDEELVKSTDRLR